MSKDRKERLRKKQQDNEHKKQKRVEAIRARVPLSVIGQPDRQCGECQACCEVVAIKGDNMTPEKKNYERCVHQCDKGCAVYSSRPVECRTYMCEWRTGTLTDEDDRPDKLGVIIDTRNLTDTTGQDRKPLAANGKPVTIALVLWEVRPGALKTERVQSIIKWIKKNMSVAVMVNPYGLGDDSAPGDVITRKIL